MNNGQETVQKPTKNKSQIVIMGGKNSNSMRIDSIEFFDGQVWYEHPKIKMRKAKSGFSSVFYRNQSKNMNNVFVIGGNDGQV